MTAKEKISHILECMPEDLVREVQHFAEFLCAKSHESEWSTYSAALLAARYVKEEIEYTTDDLKP